MNYSVNLVLDNSLYLKFVRLASILRGKKNQTIMRYFQKGESVSHIAMFHKITTTGLISNDENECRIEDLIDYIEYCKKSEIEFVSIGELLAMEPSEACRNKAVITFDDGFESFCTVASHELIERRIPFLCFIVTSLIDMDGYISTEQLKSLAHNKFCTVGMHSDRHIFWRGRKSEELIDDYLKCRSILTNIIGYEPQYYAFPFGSYFAVSSSNIKTIRKMNPKCIFLTDQRKIMPKDVKDPLRGLPRLDISGYYRGAYKEEYKGLDIGKKDSYR